MRASLRCIAEACSPMPSLHKAEEIPAVHRAVGVEVRVSARKDDRCADPEWR